MSSRGGLPSQACVPLGSFTTALLPQPSPFKQDFSCLNNCERLLFGDSWGASGSGGDSVAVQLWENLRAGQGKS